MLNQLVRADTPPRQAQIVPLAMGLRSVRLGMYLASPAYVCSPDIRRQEHHDDFSATVFQNSAEGVHRSHEVGSGPGEAIDQR
jgi:hypothetical protein